MPSPKIVQKTEKPGTAKDVSLNGKVIYPELTWKRSLCVSTEGIEVDGKMLPWKNARSWVVGPFIYGSVVQRHLGVGGRSKRDKEDKDTPKVKPDPYPVVEKKKKKDDTEIKPEPQSSKASLPSFSFEEAQKMYREVQEAAHWWDADQAFQKKIIKIIISKIKKTIENNEEMAYIYDSACMPLGGSLFNNNPQFVQKWLVDNGYKFEMGNGHVVVYTRQDSN